MARSPETNALEVTVSELSGALKRTIEDTFGYVRVRGEVGRVSRPGSGHVYLDLKDDRSVLAGVIWKGQVAKLKHRPEEGLEVVATGRITTFAGQSKYQIVIDSLEPAGAGALMALLEERRRKLAAEGLFDEARKRAIPFMPRVIGVVTSPTGAVIRDILHRVHDRFPVHVVVWPVRVQGETTGAEVANGIHRLATMPADGPVPRPDVIIVARGGGSVEDLWGFNDEAVVRAAAACPVPLISAVGHETDWTLIDHAADWRAPTPTAAAERAVPVKADLEAAVADRTARLRAAASRLAERRRERLRSLVRALPSLDALLDGPRQRFDRAAERQAGALRHRVANARALYERRAGAMGPALLRRGLDRRRSALVVPSAVLARLPDRLTPLRRERVDRAGTQLARALLRHVQGAQRRRDGVTARLVPAPILRQVARHSQRLSQGGARLDRAAARFVAGRSDRLEKAARLLTSLSYQGVLERGFAVLRDADGQPLGGVSRLAAGHGIEVEMKDGRIGATVKTTADKGPAASEGAARTARAPRRRGAPAPTGTAQGDLF